MTQQPDQRRDPRAMLAEIALATDLPVPATVSFHPNGAILALNMPTIVAGQAWSVHLGGSTDTYVYNGHRYLREGVIVWHGWSVHLHASEPATPGAPLSADTTGRLAALAEA